MNTFPAKTVRIALRIMVVFGVGLCIVSIWLTVRTANFLSTAQTVPGTVVDHEATQSSSNSGTTYHTVFEYVDFEGNTHRKTSSWSSQPPAYEVGEAIDVLVPPNDPAGGRIRGFASLWLAPIICGALGVGAIILPGIALWAMRRMDGQQNSDTLTRAAEPTH